ncbi:MAG: hypothetical protein IH969_01255, partial [Candidatus Krumholzibacteriota bacterium]|nr:hypothetical protein [Candidatus Krumholzibacteriota bacterium]
ALTLQHLDRRAAAEEQLRRAAAIDRDDPDIVRALAIFYGQDSAWEKALPWAQRLVALQPNVQDSQGMLQRIETELER